MSDDSDASLPLPGSPAAGPGDHPEEDCDSGSDHPPIPPSRKIILQMSSPEEAAATSPSLPLDEIPYPTELIEKDNSMEPEPEAEIPLPPDSSDSKYSPSQASAEDASPASETQQKKTVAVLGRAQAMKRLKAFSAAKLAATSTTSGSGVKKSPIKGVSVFSGKSSSDSKQPTLAIASIKEEETKMREILAMNSLLNEKLKTVHAITGSIPGPGQPTAIVKPTLLNPEFRSNPDSLDKSDLPGKASEDKITSFHVKKQMKNIRRKRASSSSSVSRSRSKSPGVKRRANERRSRSRDRDKERDRDRDSYRRDRDRDRVRERDRENERKRVKRSRSRSKNREHDRRRSKSPRSKDKSRRRSRTRSRDRKRRSRSRERKKSLSRSLSREKEKEVKHRDKSPVVIREVKRKSVSPQPLREKKQRSLSPLPLRKSRSRSQSKERRKSRSRSKSVEVKTESRKKSRSRSREREGKSRRKSPSKHKKKDKDRDRERDREREKEKLLEKERREKEEKKEAERKRERERQEAVERELDKVRTIRMPVDWKEYKKFQYSPDNVREVWNSIFKDSKARSRSRSSSRSPSRPKELPSSPTFSRTLIQSPNLIKTVPVELRTSIKRDYPVEFLKTTKQKPTLEYGCNRLSIKGYYKSRDVFKEESPEVVRGVENILCPDLTTNIAPSPLEPSKVQPWFAEHAQLFCPSEGSKGIVISHLYSDEEMEEAPPIRSKLSTITKAEKPIKKAEVSAEPSKSIPVPASSTSTTVTRPSSQNEPMEEEYSTESSQSQDSVPSPLLKTRYGADLPPPPEPSLPVVLPDEEKPLSDEDGDDDEEEVQELPVLSKSVPPPEEKKLKTKDKKKDKKKKKKKDSKKHHRRHRRDSKKHSKSDDEEESEEKNPDSESSHSDDGSKSKALKKKKSRKDEEEQPPTKPSSKLAIDDSKKKISKATSSSSGKTSKKHSKKSRKGKYSESDESEQSSSSEGSKESSSSSSGSESDGKEKKKKKKRTHRKKRDKKEDKDDSSDDEPHDRGDKGGAGGSSGRSGGTNDRSRSHRKDRDNKERDRDRDGRRSRDRDRDRDRSDRKKRRHDGLDLETQDSIEDCKDGSSSSTSSSSSYSSSHSNSSNNSSSYSSANEDDEHASHMNMHTDSQFQLALQISKIQQIGLEEKTENDSQIISKMLTQIEHDEIMGSMKKVGGDEKYDPFLDVDVEEDMKMGIPIIVSGNSVGSDFKHVKVEPELSRAEDLLKTFDNDHILQLVMTDHNLSAENLLAQFCEPDHQDAPIGNIKDEVKSSTVPATPPDQSTSRKKVATVIESQFIPEVTSQVHKAEAVKTTIHKEEVVLHHRKSKDLVAALDVARYVDPYELSPCFENTDDAQRTVEESRRSDRTSGRSYSRSYSRSRSRSRSYSPSSRRRGRSRKIVQDRRYHPYSDRHDGYRPNERRERYTDGHRGREIRERGYDDRYSRFDRHRHSRDGRDRERPIVFRRRDRSLEEYELGHTSRRYERIGWSEKDRLPFENHYREESVLDHGERPHEDLIEKPITTICNVNPPVSSEADLEGAEASPPLRLNVADSTINDSDLADNIALGFVDNVEDNRACRSNLKEIIPQSDPAVISVLDSSAPAPGYASPPKRLSLDERLEMEMGIKLREEVTPARPSFPLSVFTPGQGDFVPGECQAPKGDDGWLPQVPIQEVQAVAHEVTRTVPRQSQAIPLGDLIQVLPGQMLDRSFTVTKQNSKLNPFEVQQTATQVIRKVGDEMDPKKCVNIKVPVLPFKIPVFGHPDLESIQAAEQEKENRILVKRQEKEQKRLEKKRRQHEKRKQLLKKRMLKKKEMMAKKKLAMEVAKREREEKSLKTRESNNVGTEMESSTAVDPEELKLLKEALTEVPTDLAEDSEGHAPVSTEPELIRDKILPVDDMHEADEHEEDTEGINEPASPTQSSNIELPNSAVEVKVALPKKGILYMTGLKKEKSSKGVKFADGVLPGHGSSRSEGEDIHSPPPGQENLVKKKKVKVNRERKKKTKPIIEIDPNAPKLTPPPPPKEPYPYCPLGILYQFNPPYAIVYAQTLAELGFEITFTPSMETPKDFTGEELEADESHSVQIESLNQSISSTTVPMSELGAAAPTKSSAWSESPDSKDRAKKKRKHREHKDIDSKTHSASALDPPSSRHSSHRHKEHKHKSAHAQRIPTIVSSVPSSKHPDAIPPQDFHPVDGGRITPRIVKELETDSQLSLRENKNLISLSSHHEEHLVVSALHDANTMKNLPFEDTQDVAAKPEIPVECKRVENNRFKHHENHRVRNRHVDNNRINAHNEHYENHRVEHHKRSESHHLDSPKQLENHRLDRLERKLIDNKRSEYGHSDWKSEHKISEKTSDNPNLIQISPSKLDLTNKSPLPKNKKAFTESFVEVPRTPELDGEKGSEFQTIAPIPIISRAKPIKIKMNTKTFNKVSDTSIPLAMRPVLTGKINSTHSSSALVPKATNCKDIRSSPIAPPLVLPAVTLSPVSPIVSQISSPQSLSPNVQIPMLHPPTYDYYNQISAMVPPLNIPPVPPIIPPTLSPRLPCGIDLTRPPPAFTSSLPTAAVNASASSPTFATATRVPGVRITHSSPGQSRRPPHKGNRS